MSPRSDHSIQISICFYENYCLPLLVLRHKRGFNTQNGISSNPLVDSETPKTTLAPDEMMLLWEKSFRDPQRKNNILCSARIGVAHGSLVIYCIHCWCSCTSFTDLDYIQPHISEKRANGKRSQIS